MLPLGSFAQVQMGLGGQIINFDYKEDLPFPKKSEEMGTNVHFAYDAKINLDDSFINFNGDFTFAAVTNYDGSTQSGNVSQPASATDNHTFHRHEALYYGHVSDSVFVYTGIGYRYWKRFLAYGTGYTEDYSWFYTPVGIYVGLASPMNMTKFNYGVDFSIRPMTQGQIIVTFSDRIASGQDSTMSLGNRTGYKVKVPLSIPWKDLGLQISLTPWYEFSQIGESNPVYNSTPGIAGDIVEPSSTTSQFGIESLVQFTF